MVEEQTRFWRKYKFRRNRSGVKRLRKKGKARIVESKGNRGPDITRYPSSAKRAIPPLRKSKMKRGLNSWMGTVNAVENWENGRPARGLFQVVTEKLSSSKKKKGYQGGQSNLSGSGGKFVCLLSHNSRREESPQRRC